MPGAWVGALIVTRRPGNRIGLLALATGLLWATDAMVVSYLTYGPDAAGILPGVVAFSWLASWLWLPQDVAFMLGVLLYPDGHLPSRRWRPVVWLVIGWATLSFIASAVHPELVLLPGHRNPIGLSGPAGSIVQAMASLVLDPFELLLSLVCTSALVVRFRRARGIERQQLKWLMYAGALIALIAWMRLVVPTRLIPWVDLADTLATWGLIGSIGIAILRYHLYDIDHIINRTLVYGALTLLLGGVYAAAVLVLGLLFGGLSDQPPGWTVAGATLAVAALFQPARRRIQTTVDRRFNRRKYDTAKTIQAFSTRLRDHVDLDTLSTELLAVVDQTMEPTRVSLWLRSSAPGSSGTPRSEVHPTTWAY